MKCKYCGNEISKNPMVVGPKKLGLIYCSKKCNVLECIEKYPSTSLVNMLQKMYPDII